MPLVSFFCQDIVFKIQKPRKTAAWLEQVVAQEKKSLSGLNYIFCSDEYLLQINQQYLNHYTYTDIITFDNSDEGEGIEGDVFISVDRVRDNAAQFETTLEDEVHRVLVHGLLHLCGYGDKTQAEKKLMRKKEDQYLSLRPK